MKVLIAEDKTRRSVIRTLPHAVSFAIINAFDRHDMDMNALFKAKGEK